MNIYELILIFKDRPGIYFGKSKIDSLSNIGFFINGFLCAEASLGQTDDFDMFFDQEFSSFVRNKIGIELSRFEFWFETINKKVNNNEAAIDLFFKLFDEFYSLYEKKENNF